MKSKIRNDERANIFCFPWLMYNAFLIVREPKINENSIEPVEFTDSDFFLEKTFLIKTGDRCTTDFEFENKRYGFECQRYGIKTSNKKDV